MQKESKEKIVSIGQLSLNVYRIIIIMIISFCIAERTIDCGNKAHDQMIRPQRANTAMLAVALWQCARTANVIKCRRAAH